MLKERKGRHIVCKVCMHFQDYGYKTRTAASKGYACTARLGQSSVFSDAISIIEAQKKSYLIRQLACWQQADNIGPPWNGFHHLPDQNFDDRQDKRKCFAAASPCTPDDVFSLECCRNACRLDVEQGRNTLIR
jgi:hypothetical protein